MFDNVVDKINEYGDYLQDTNDTIVSGLNKIKELFGGIVEKYRK